MESVTDMYFSYFWDSLFYLLVVQTTFVSLLIVPLPSNAARGFILNALDKIWSGIPYFQPFCVFTAMILAFILAGSVHARNNLQKFLLVNGNRDDTRCSIIEADRNICMTGFSLFLTCVTIRLMQVNKKLFLCKLELKQLTNGSNINSTSKCNESDKNNEKLKKVN